jgi:integrase
MPRTKKDTPPSYRRHCSGQAIVTVRTQSGRRRDMLLGAHDSASSRYEYERILSVLKRNKGRYPDVEPTDDESLTVDEVLLAWWNDASTRYSAESLEMENYRQALRPVRALYSNREAAKFTPKCLKAVRRRMVETQEYLGKKAGAPDAKPRWLSLGWVKPEEKLARLERHGKRNPGKEKWVRVEILGTRPALPRKVINRHLVRIRAVFNWAVSEELIPAAVAEGIRTVKGLQVGEMGVKENRPRASAFWDSVIKVVPHCPPPVGAMLQLQWLTGMRSGEVRMMRTMDIEKIGPGDWVYRPGSDRPHGRHKNAW